MKPSASQNRAKVACPLCDDDSDGIAVVGGDESERGSHAVLDAFSCPNGHTQDDLSPSQERATLDSALDYLADARGALTDLGNDQRYDQRREDGR